jgi:hypothetical protein
MSQNASFQQDIDELIKSKELYFIGERLPADWYEGLGNWLPLADAGDAKAQFNVGYCYEHGEGINHDLAKAYDYYTKASNQHDPRALYNLGLMYLNGVYVEKSKDHALELLTQAMELGDVRAPRWVLDDKARNAYNAGNTAEAKQYLLKLLKLSKENFRDSDQHFAKAGILALSFSEGELVISATRKKTYAGDYLGTFAEVKSNIDLPAEIGKVTGFVNDLVRLDGYDYNIFLDTYRGRDAAEYTFLSGDDYTSRVGYSQGKYDQHNKEEAEGFYLRDNYKAVSFELGKESREIVFVSVTIKCGHNEYYNLDFNKPKSITIPEKSGCFVLTACYESYDAPTVFAFRQYRDNHLSRTKFGRGFIQWYYTHGPKMAEFISDKPKVKAILKFIFNQIAKVLPR